MTTDMAITFGTLALAMVLFVSDRVRLDVVAVGVVVVLMLTGVLTPAESVAGFADPVVVMVAALFLVGEGLTATGVADKASDFIERKGGSSPLRLMGLSMVVVAVLSAFLSSTGAVAIMLPVMLRVSRTTGISPSKLLMPLSFAALLGGTLTLIGTAPNLVVSGALAAQGYEEFGFFDFTPVGAVIVAAGVVYMIALGRRLLPGAETLGTASKGDTAVLPRVSVRDLAAEYGLVSHLARFTVESGSDLARVAVGDMDLPRRFGCTILAVEDVQGRAEPVFGSAITGATVVPAGATLLLQGDHQALERAAREAGLRRHDWEPTFDRRNVEGAVAEVALTPRSKLLGRSLIELTFRDRYDLYVLGIRHGDDPVRGDYADRPLRFGDTLLVQGSPDRMNALTQRRNDFIVVSLPEELEHAEAPADRAGSPTVAVGLVVAMLIAMTLDVAPHVGVVLAVALAMVLTRCVRLPRAYNAVNWESLVLIAGMLPAATALQNSGGVDLIVDGLLGAVGEWGPTPVLAVMFLLTTGLSLVMSNTATTVLVAPVALQAAVALGASPQAFMMTVAVAASSAVSTPMSSPPNTLVLGAGHYRFMDYVKVGLPLQLLILVLTLLVVPLLF